MLYAVILQGLQVIVKSANSGSVLAINAFFMYTVTQNIPIFNFRLEQGSLSNSWQYDCRSQSVYCELYLCYSALCAKAWLALGMFEIFRRTGPPILGARHFRFDLSLD